ncbi:MAG: VOC family protein [Myxococcota bacterium]
MQLNHLHLRVRDVAVARRFYSEYFDMREHAQHGDVLFMTDDARCDLALAPAEQVEALPAWFHFGFRLDDPDRVRALYARMSTAGVTIVCELEDEPAQVSFRCADPDGYTIEIYWE